uniref:Peptidase M13 C-terminal domain-containing protein n=2 Tax=Parascaris univalens TaxID=6257 RepID=A0A915BL77_PARUN
AVLYHPGMPVLFDVDTSVDPCDDFSRYVCNKANLRKTRDQLLELATRKLEQNRSTYPLVYKMIKDIRYFRANLHLVKEYSVQQASILSNLSGEETITATAFYMVTKYFDQINAKNHITIDEGGLFVTFDDYAKRFTRQDSGIFCYFENCTSEVQQFASSVVDFIIFNETDEYDVTRKNITIEGNVAAILLNESIQKDLIYAALLSFADDFRTSSMGSLLLTLGTPFTTMIMGDVMWNIAQNKIAAKEKAELARMMLQLKTTAIDRFLATDWIETDDRIMDWYNRKLNSITSYFPFASSDEEQLKVKQLLANIEQKIEIAASIRDVNMAEPLLPQQWMELMAMASAEFRYRDLVDSFAHYLLQSLSMSGSSSSNTITFGLGLLADYDARFPAAFNYGRYGSFMAHEVFHSFSPSVRSSSLPTFIAQERKFARAIQCYSDYYSTFCKRFQVGTICLNGERKMTEGMPDTEGIRTAYETALSNLHKTFFHPSQIQGFSNEQLFFIGSALWICEGRASENVPYTNRHFRYPPRAVRINAAMRQIPQFTSAFNCSRSSYMGSLSEFQLCTPYASSMRIIP